MVQYTESKMLDSKVKYVEISCLSTDAKPTRGIATGSVCIEVDTAYVYLFDEESATWEKVGG